MSPLRRLPVFTGQSLLRVILLCMPLLDELVSGFLFIGLPLASKQLQLDYTQIGLLFAAGALSSMVLDPLINLLSDRRAKRPWILYSPAGCKSLIHSSGFSVAILFSLFVK